MTTCFSHLSQLISMQGALAKDGRKLVSSDLSIIEDGAIIFDRSQILWVGKTQDIPRNEFSITQEYPLPGHILIPELVDSRTHTVFGGDRASEYGSRLDGKTYQEIAQEGGGISRTSLGTNQLNLDQLFELAVDRINKMRSYGVGTIEIKSGYGLNYQREKELTLLIDRLKKKFSPSLQIFNTFMPAHAIPKSCPSSKHYMEQIVLPLLKELAPLKIIDAVDIFHEVDYFSTSDVCALFDLCQQLSIPTKIHADEFNDNGGAELATLYQSLSADHLLATSSKGILALSQSSTVAVLLPGTAFFLGKPLARARALLDAGAKVAIATDFNPGSCHLDNLLSLAQMSGPSLKMNRAELLAAITLNAAHALGLKNQGAIIPGFAPRFSLFQLPTLDHLFYFWGTDHASKKIFLDKLD